MLKAQGSGWARAAELFPLGVLGFFEGCSGQQEGRDGNSSATLLGILPKTAQGRDLGAFRLVQKVSFTGECFS